MKLLLQYFVLLICLLWTSVTLAQSSPDGILFQAVARDASGNAAAGRTEYAKVSILSDTITRTVVYAEKFTVLSNAEGVFTLVIGRGTRTAGAAGLSFINWSTGSYFINIKVAVAPTVTNPSWVVDNEYVDMGTSQLWSVPYAFFASKAFLADSSKGVTGQWYVFAVTQDANSVKFYLNGNLVGTTTGTTLSQYVSAPNEFIGNADNFWLGDIGTTMIYKRGLTDAEIQQNYLAIKATYY